MRAPTRRQTFTCGRGLRPSACGLGCSEEGSGSHWCGARSTLLDRQLGSHAHAYARTLRNLPRRRREATLHSRIDYTLAPYGWARMGDVGVPRCIITDEEITRENDSKAHVIPSALGGRLKPLGILSKNGNSLLGDKLDLPLIQAFQSLMTLLNGSRDRGKNQPMRMSDESGRVYVIEFGEPLTLAHPEYREEQVNDGTAFHIDARNLKEARTLLGRVKAAHPEFDIDEALKHAVAVRSWPDGMLHGQLQIGPSIVFPALFVAASIFAAYHGHAPHPLLRDYVGRFDPDHPEMPPGTFYFIPAQPWISAPGEVTHIVALLASAERQEMLVYFELFNAVSVGVLLPYAGSEDARAAYAVDVLAGAEVTPTINEEVLAPVRWQATHNLGDPELLSFTQDRIGRLIGLSQKRAFDAEADALMKRAFGEEGKGPLTPVDLVKGVVEIVDHTLLQWQRPSIKQAHMEEQLRQFDKMVGTFERAFPGPALAPFRALTGELRRRLAAEIASKRKAVTPQSASPRRSPPR